MRPVDDEIKAQRLAAWLSSPAGTAPPEDLDPEVLGAVWALAPDRAPAPRVSIDDIFSLVTEGPFAPGAGAAPSVEGGTSGEVVRFPGNVGDEASGEWDAEDLTYVAPTGPARLVAHPGGKVEAPVVAKVAAPVVAAPAATPIPPESSKVVPLARRAPSRAWMVPTLGLALAAAAATLIVVPTMGKLSPAGLVEQEEAREAKLSPPPPPSAIAEVPAEVPAAVRAEAPTEGSPALSAGPAGDASVAQARGGEDADVVAAKAEARREEPVGSAGLAPADRGDASGRGFSQPNVGAVPELKENEGPSMASSPDSTSATESVARRRDADIASAPSIAEEATSSAGGYPTGGYGSGAPAPSTTTSTSSTPTRSQAPSASSDKAGRTYIPEAAGPSAPREAADDSLLDGAVYEQDEAEQPVTAGRVESAKKDRKSGASKPSRSSAAYDESDNAPAAPAPSGPGAAASNTLTTSARGSAWPNDYDAGWYRALTDVAPIFDAARADEAAGRFDAALARYRTLTADARPAVAQDATLRAAKALKALGRNAEALATVDTGLNRSGANTPFRASLYALRGDLLVLLGRASDAEAAWASAATLNEAR
jgi:hypothetical protein